MGGRRWFIQNTESMLFIIGINAHRNDLQEYRPGKRGTKAGREMPYTGTSLLIGLAFTQRGCILTCSGSGT